MKKRIPSFLLAGLMALSLTVPALAADITINGVGSVDIGKLACPDVRSARNGVGRIIR